MLNLFIKMVIGLIVTSTIAITILPSVLIFAITGRFYIQELFEWCIMYED